MPGPGGGVNSGGFGGGIYTGSDGTTYLVPDFSIESITDLFFKLSENTQNLWISLNKPFYTFLSDIAIGDGEGVLSKIFSNVFDLFEAININSFLNQFTTLEFLFGSGILVILSWSILRSFKFR